MLTGSLKLKTKYSVMEKNEIFAKAVNECEELAREYIQGWKPINKSWEIIDGVAYVRVSDFKQVIKDKGSLIQQVNIAVQEAMTRSHREGVNFRIIKFEIEPGYSGTSNKRPALRRLIGGVKRGVYQFIILREFSRFTRNKNYWDELFEECKARQCEITIRGRTYNMHNPQDVKQLDMLALQAEHESETISERTKDINYAAAAFNGKENGTRSVLGLDPLIKNGIPEVGIYEVNKEEIKTVVRIMETFLSFGSYPETLKALNQKGILNKGGILFTDSTLKTLLTNTRYIGIMVRNELNKHLKQEKLMPYDKYEVIKLKHGEVIPIELWERVQRMIEELSKRNDRNDTEPFIWSGTLKSLDGSNYHGSNHKKKNARYYVNSVSGDSVRADLIEEKGKEVILNVIESDSKFKSALKQAMKDNERKIDVIELERLKIQRNLEECQEEKVKLDNRLDFYLQDPDKARANSFRETYFKERDALDTRISNYELTLKSLGQNQEELRDGYNVKGITERVREVWELMEKSKKDKEDFSNRVILKNLIRSMFAAVWVGEKDEIGNRELVFELKSGEYSEFLLEEGNPHSHPVSNCVGGTKKVRDRVGMG